ncbi:hypothetical protein ABXI96_17330, partial [Gordonia polyisoprenivorans]|uniref:hypothetical protein n=1 Tax=Gordonia polyisoprenivorans TaxID=84595 RepID=UPI0033950C66
MPGLSTWTTWAGRRRASAWQYARGLGARGLGARGLGATPHRTEYWIAGACRPRGDAGSAVALAAGSVAALAAGMARPPAAR